MKGKRKKSVPLDPNRGSECKSELSSSPSPREQLNKKIAWPGELKGVKMKNETLLNVKSRPRRAQAGERTRLLWQSIHQVRGNEAHEVVSRVQHS